MGSLFCERPFEKSPTPQVTSMQRKYNFNELSSESSSDDGAAGSIHDEEEIEGEVSCGEAEEKKLKEMLQTDDGDVVHETGQYVPDMTDLKGLVASKQAYYCLERFETDWPFLSLDYICLGEPYQQEPFEFCFLGGTTTTSMEKPSI